VVCVIFVFQAEDGIRDATVTGVQTCALPICCFSNLGFAFLGCGNRLRGEYQPHPGAPLTGDLFGCVVELDAAFVLLKDSADDRRSEERRVGKEWRLSWRP